MVLLVNGLHNKRLGQLVGLYEKLSRVSLYEYLTPSKDLGY